MSSKEVVVFSHANPHADLFALKQRLVSIGGHDIVVAQRPAVVAKADSGSMDVTGTGAVLWDAAIVLAHYLDEYVVATDSSNSKKRKPVAVELGAGLGLVSVALAKRGVSVVATDADEDVLPLLRENIERNGVEASVEVRTLWWGAPLEEEKDNEKTDLVVGSDVVFRAEAIDPLIRTLWDLTAGNATALIVLAFKIRFAFHHKFLRRAAAFFEIEHAPNEHIHSDFRRHSGISVVRMRRRDDVKAAPPRPANTSVKF